MADFTAQTYSFTTSQGSQYSQVVTSYPLPGTFTEGVSPGQVRRIKMRWLDVDALPSVVYRVWSVVNGPDPTGAYYSGSKSGSTPISGATVEEDFNA